MMKKQNLYTSIAIVIVAVLAVIFLMGRHVTAPVETDQAQLSQDIAVDMICRDEKNLRAVFHLPGDATADVYFADGRIVTLPHAISADGGRYANTDESIVFWTKGETAFVTENGTETYSDCNVANVSPSGTDNDGVEAQ